MFVTGELVLGCLTKVEIGNNLKVKVKDLIEEVYLGHVVSAGCGQAPATQAIRLAGLSTSIPAITFNKVCASGMKAVSLAASMIKSGNANCILAGGMESMSSAPFTIPTQLRCPNRGLRFGDSELTDLLAKDGLIDAETGLPMGEAAERIAEAHGITRQEMEEYSKGTFNRAIESKHLFESEEIISIPSHSNPNISVIEDDGPKTFKPEKFASLRTPFRPENGRVTAATSSQLTDGAAVMLLMSEEMVKELGINPLARVITWADAGVEDAMEFPIAPVKAVEKCYKSANLSESQIDLHEINEAFAVVPLAVSRLCSIPLDKVNVLGGSVALGHPLGASGARIIGTLMTALKSKKMKRGCASICNGGGGASAIIIELCE